MGSHDQRERLAQDLRSSFEAGLPMRLERAKSIRLVNVVPNHWFTAAASDCARMYIAGHFYGAILVGQAYIEALSKFIAGKHGTQNKGQVEQILKVLKEKGVLSNQACNAGLEIFKERNDFHHLNIEVETDYQELERIAQKIINNICVIESEVFSHSIEKGKLISTNTMYWPMSSDGRCDVYIRNVM